MSDFQQMDMNAFEERQAAIAENSGMEWGDIPRLVIQQSTISRLVGNFVTVWEHFITMPTGARPYLCEGPNSDCPICKAVMSLTVSEDEAAQKLADEIKAKEKFYFNALDRSPVGREWHKQSKKSKVLAQNEKGLSVGTMVFKAIGSIVAMRKSQGQDGNPNNYDIMFSKSGSGLTTKYTAQFTGAVEPLTLEEKAYELWNLKDIAKIATRAERESVADLLLSGRIAPKQESENVSPKIDPNRGQAAGPVQRQPNVRMQPAQAPKTASSPIRAPQQQQQVQQPAQPTKLVIRQSQQQYQSTAMRDHDPATHLVVPCQTCQVDMLIDLDDLRDLQCHSCGKIYNHPNAS